MSKKKKVLDKEEVEEVEEQENPTRKHKSGDWEADNKKN